MRDVQKSFTEGEQEIPVQKTSLTRLVMSAMAMASITMAVLPAQATPLPSCQPAIIDSNETVSQVPAAAPPVEVAIKKKGTWKTTA